MEPEDYSRLIARALPASAETVPLGEAVGRLLARDVAAPAPIPGFATSAMDGYALDPLALDRARRGEWVPVRG
ncbi:molybdopterin molybdenumtransferase MoeA, partial [Burkholderia multivorans]